MGFWNKLFATRDSAPEELTPVFERMRRQEEGRKLADQAISYRNVGNFDKALELLMRALTDFAYDPAIILIGTTALKKGSVKEAVRWFELQIQEKERSDDFPLIELYSNLGSIYHNYCKNDAKALEMYKKALEAPRPPVYGDDAYALMESNVYHDMAIVYRSLDDPIAARLCAERRLRVIRDCTVCKDIVESVFIGLNKSGDVAAAAVRLPDGRSKAIVVDNQPNSLTYSNFLVFAQWLLPEDRVIFSRWAALPEREWTHCHIEFCALAMMHYFCTASDASGPVSDAVRNLQHLLIKEQLPPLDRPLTDQVIGIFSRISGAIK